MWKGGEARTESNSRFPIPGSLQDLEHSPYNLFPYPTDFQDDDEATRAESFDNLVELLETGNELLSKTGLALFEKDSEEEWNSGEEWPTVERMQALYTLVRKASSLAPTTRSRFLDALCTAILSLCHILSTAADNNQQPESHNNKSQTQRDGFFQPLNRTTTSPNYVMSQSFRDTLACHLYMLFSAMSSMEAEVKVGRESGTVTAAIPASKKGSKSKKSQTIPKDLDFVTQTPARQACAHAMRVAAETMAKEKSVLWTRAVADEALVTLPCRIAYQMLENSVNATARKTSCGDDALQIIACTIRHGASPSVLTTLVAAIMDLMHSAEHIAPMIAELCVLAEIQIDASEYLGTKSSSAIRYPLSVELLRELSRLQVAGDSALSTGGKAIGIKNVAPFIDLLAERQPHLVMSYMGLLLTHLNSEPYVLRSAIVAAISHIIVLVKASEEGQLEAHAQPEDSESHEDPSRAHGAHSKTKDSLFKILLERYADISSYTRSTVLKAWIHIVQNKALPVNKLMPVTGIAIDRLQDKAVIVRRSSMQLLTLILENNPFMGSLSPEPYRNKADEFENFLKSAIPARITKNVCDALTSERHPDAKISDQEIIESSFAYVNKAFDSGELEPNDDSETHFFNKLKAYRFASAALNFIDLFEQASDTFNNMLHSSNSSDVTEAIRFFVRARQFDLPCSVTGMKQALALLWSTEPAIIAEVLNGFVDVFIAVPETCGQEFLPNEQIVLNLISLVTQATVSEMASIEEAVSCLVKEDRIPAEVFLMLWAFVSKANGKTRSASMLLISMGASANKVIVDSVSRLRILCEVGLGDEVQENRDWELIRCSACALQHIGRAQDTAQAGSAKAIVLELIIEQLALVIEGSWCRDHNETDTMHWFSAAEQVIDAIFDVSSNPEQICGDVIKRLTASIFMSNSTSCTDLQLSRLFFIVGHVALKLLVYTEKLGTAITRANATKNLKQQEALDKAKVGNSSAKEEGEAIENELGVAAETEAEHERFLADISENEIVGRGLLAVYGPVLGRVVSNDCGTFSSPILLQSASLALCKMMCVSSSFCETYLPLLFGKLEHDDIDSAGTTFRANLAVAMGDLAFRFPNSVEPYTSRIYACLRDPSARVRRHTMMVLTHLILNDMVKVKGQVCEIAMCLEDKDPRIRDMSRLLFSELSKRSNSPIYNLLPDIISRLSHSELPLSSFKSIMSFLIGFIKKERQNEVLMDKICQRFPSCNSISQKAALAFCLANLKVNEKCIKILNDCFKYYKDALFDEEVSKSFCSIASKAKQTVRPEFKQQVSDFEERIKQENQRGLADFKAGDNAKQAKAKQTRTKTSKRHKAKNIEEGEDESDKEDESNSDLEESPKDLATVDKAKSRHVRTKASKRRQSKNIEESDESNSDLEETPKDLATVDKAKSKHVRTKASKRRQSKNIEESDGESDKQDKNSCSDFEDKENHTQPKLSKIVTARTPRRPQRSRKGLKIDD